MESYINDKKRLYTNILDFLENTDECSEKNYQIFSTKIKNEQNEEYSEEIEQFLQIIKSIGDHHHRDKGFIKKIDEILLYYKEQIKQTLLNYDLFHIFESNKLILLFLIKSNIITISEPIFNEMINKLEPNGNRYCHFFYPEIENFIGDEKKLEDVKKELLSKYPNVFDDFDKKRQEGENDSHICSLIRQDSVKEFIAYVNRNSISLSSHILPSIFETNLFLIENKNITLIEYSAFFGSIQIFQYLLLNKVELTPSLWLYSIHSKNADLIHLLESNEVPPPNSEFDKDYIECFIESIKCHHNDFADYIENNFRPQKENDFQHKEIIISNCIKYYNYFYFQTEIINDHGFFYLCLNNYNELVDLLLKKKKDEIETKIIKQLNILIKK